MSRLRAATAGLCLVSTAFPIVASLVPAVAITRAIGIADVATAALLLVAGGLVVAKAPKAFDAGTTALAFRVLRAASSGFLVLLLVFFLAPGAVDWTVLLVGLAWRAWLFVLVFPAWIAVR